MWGRLRPNMSHVLSLSYQISIFLVLWGRPPRIFHTKLPFSSICGDHASTSSHTKLPFSSICGGHAGASSHTKFHFFSICGDSRQQNRPTKLRFSCFWYVAGHFPDITNSTFLLFGMTWAIFLSSHFAKSSDLWGQARRRQRFGPPQAGSNRTRARGAGRRVQLASVTGAQSTAAPVQAKCRLLNHYFTITATPSGITVTLASLPIMLSAISIASVRLWAGIMCISSTTASSISEMKMTLARMRTRAKI